jgi:hypothetical protein
MSSPSNSFPQTPPAKEDKFYRVRIIERKDFSLIFGGFALIPVVSSTTHRASTRRWAPMVLPNTLSAPTRSCLLRTKIF